MLTPVDTEFTAGDDQGSPEIKLAHGFNDVVQGIFSGPVPAAVVAGGCATLLNSYLAQLEPEHRVLILSELVDVLITGLRDNVDTDLTIH